MYWWLVLHPLYCEHQKMKSCNRSPCCFPACAMVSCAWTLSDVKHHPVTGTTPRQGRGHRGNEQSSTLAVFGSGAVTLPTAASWQFNPTQGGLWEDKDQSCSIWCNMASTRGSIWVYKVKINYLPSNQGKNSLSIPAVWKHWGEEWTLPTYKIFHIEDVFLPGPFCG